MVDRKERVFKMAVLFLFVVFLFGCSHKYVDVEDESLREKIIVSWEKLDSKIVGFDEQGFYLGLEVRRFAVVSDSVELVKLYRRGFRRKVEKIEKVEKKGSRIPLGMAVGCVGCLGGFYCGKYLDGFWSSDRGGFDIGCLLSFTSCVTGIGIALGGVDHGRKVSKVLPVPDFAKMDTICLDAKPLSVEKVKISVEDLNFKKSYYTDEYGVVEFKLKFDEVSSELYKTGSTLELIIQYKKLVDTVEVGCL